MEPGAAGPARSVGATAPPATATAIGAPHQRDAGGLGASARQTERERGRCGAQVQDGGGGERSDAAPGPGHHRRRDAERDRRQRGERRADRDGRPAEGHVAAGSSAIGRGACGQSRQPYRAGTTSMLSTVDDTGRPGSPRPWAPAARSRARRRRGPADRSRRRPHSCREPRAPPVSGSPSRRCSWDVLAIGTGVHRADDTWPRVNAGVTYSVHYQATQGYSVHSNPHLTHRKSCPGTESNRRHADFSPLLYQLSYLGEREARKLPRRRTCPRDGAAFWRGIARRKYAIGGAPRSEGCGGGRTANAVEVPRCGVPLRRCGENSRAAE